MENKYISLLSEKEKELAALRRENQEAIALLTLTKAYWFNIKFKWIDHQEWNEIYEQIKSFLSKSEGKGREGRI